MNRGVASSSTILTCFLLFLSTLASARYPFDSTGFDIDHTNHDSFSMSEKDVPADVNANILLPSDKPELIKPATLIQWETESESIDSKSSEPKPETIESMEVPKESSSEASDIDPFRVFSFRSMDPRIPRRHLPLSFRLGHRCHHHINHYYKPWKPRLPRREDVMLNNVELDPVARGGMRQNIPADWMRFRHVEPMFFSRERSMAMERSELLRRLYNRRHDEPENKDTGLMKRIRKFLKDF